MRRRALLLSGGVSRELDRSWYDRDVAAFYQLLQRHHGYTVDDIRVCMGPGGARPLADARLVAVTPARRDRVLDALRWLAEREEGDRAFLMVTDHGDEGGISLWGKRQILTPNDLSEAIGASPATKVIVLGQCYSGCFGACQLGSARSYAARATGPGSPGPSLPPHAALTPHTASSCTSSRVRWPADTRTTVRCLMRICRRRIGFPSEKPSAMRATTITGTWA